MPFKVKLIDRVPYLPDRIANVIKQDIIKGVFSTGSRMPAENTLARNYGVSRNVVREAIAQLRNEGIVESRQGIGTFVSESPAMVLRITEAGSLTTPERHLALFELREAIESRAAELAAKRRNTAEMTAMDYAFDDMERTMSRGKDGVDYDIAFHRSIAQASQNLFILKTIGFIAEHLRESIELTRMHSVNDDVCAVTIAEHRAILDAIRAGDGPAAHQAMEAHLGNAAKRIGINAGVKS